ncbi:MAG: hypothetical protein Q7K39_01450 [Candidatus Magasanikbacteria bacterium]|nr:hypothetical protein [Candidatus Magasanikbacteria bacterium]
MLVAPQTPGEKQLRDEIYLALVRLAQDDDQAALDKLKIFLTPVVQAWAKTRLALAKLADNKDEVARLITLRARDFSGEGSFVEYIFQSIMLDHVRDSGM